MLSGSEGDACECGIIVGVFLWAVFQGVFLARFGDRDSDC